MKIGCSSGISSSTTSACCIDIYHPYEILISHYLLFLFLSLIFVLLSLCLFVFVSLFCSMVMIMYCQIVQQGGQQQFGFGNQSNIMPPPPPGNPPLYPLSSPTPHTQTHITETCNIICATLISIILLITITLSHHLLIITIVIFFFTGGFRFG